MFGRLRSSFADLVKTSYHWFLEFKREPSDAKNLRITFILLEKKNDIMANKLNFVLRFCSVLYDQCALATCVKSRKIFDIFDQE